LRKPALELSDIVRRPGTVITGRSSWGQCRTASGFARPRRAVKPQRRIAARGRRGAWLRKRGPSDYQR